MKSTIITQTVRVWRYTMKNLHPLVAVVVAALLILAIFGLWLTLCLWALTLTPWQAAVGIVLGIAVAAVLEMKE